MTSRVLRLAGVLLAFQVLVGAQGAPTAPSAKAEDFFRVIRSNDLPALRMLAAASDAGGVKDALGTTPLHYAATYGSAESVRILLDRGADVRARTTVETTPLIFAAYSLEKTRLLVEKGADVNAHSRTGVTPLMVASSVHGNAATVQYLLEHGADPKAVRATGADALEHAALKGDAEAIRWLLAKGADPRHANNANATALMGAFETTDPDIGRLLLEGGSDVNAFNTDAGRVKNGPIALVHLTPLMFASPGAAPSTIAMLLKAGAKVNDADIRQMTPLMLAVANDDARLTTVQQLIGAGADVNAKDVYGDSVLDWALKFKNPEILAALEKAGAKSSRPAAPPAHPDFIAASPADAIERASALLAASTERFLPAGGGCVGCHHQPQVARAYASVRAAGLKPDERLQKSLRDGLALAQGGQLLNLPLMVATGGDYDGLLYQIVAMADLGDPAGPATDAIVQYLAARQDVSGAWTILQGPRPPLESGSVLRTAMAVRALKTYGWPARQQEFDERIARARKWLLTARPTTSYEQAYAAMGLRAAGATDAEVAAAGRLVLAQQKSDGGWSQNPHLNSDAYATSVALQLLREAGVLKTSDEQYRRGVAYLLRTQFPDGSWYVASRAPKLQPYFESAFPYGHDQWISVAATSFAVMALAPAAQEAAAQKKADQLRAALARMPTLPLMGTAIVIQPPSPGWTMGGRLVSVAADRTAAVAYVFIRADKDHDPILAVDRQGRILRGWGKGLFTVPHNIKVDGQGNVWTTDAGTSKVIKFSPDGRKLLEFVLGDSPTVASGGCAFPASPANGNLDFCGTTDIVVTPEGRIFVTDGYGKKRVLEYSATGEKRLREWGGAGTEPGKFTLPHGLAYDGKGVLFVTDRDGGRIERFDTSGKYLGEWSQLGNAGSLKFARGALWACIAGPALEPSGAQPARRLSYVVKIDPSTGAALGKMETVGTDFIDVTDAGEVFAGVTPGGFFRYGPAQ